MQGGVKLSEAEQADASIRPAFSREQSVYSHVREYSAVIVLRGPDAGVGVLRTPPGIRPLQTTNTTATTARH